METGHVIFSVRMGIDDLMVELEQVDEKSIDLMENLSSTSITGYKLAFLNLQFCTADLCYI